MQNMFGGPPALRSPSAAPPMASGGGLISRQADPGQAGGVAMLCLPKLEDSMPEHQLESEVPAVTVSSLLPAPVWDPSRCWA